MVLIINCVFLITIVYSVSNGAHIPEKSDKSEPLDISSSNIAYRIALVSDMDQMSRSSESKTWFSHYRKGNLSYNSNDTYVSIDWDEEPDVFLTTIFAASGRGMELSELIMFDGRLLTFCDHTGIVYEIINNEAFPWILLLNGNGKSTRGFKSEWATIKDQKLYVGSVGLEEPRIDGIEQPSEKQYIKVITTNGMVEHVDWRNQYEAMRRAMSIQYPGYITHESGLWSNIHLKWFFLPRKCSFEVYEKRKHQISGCNVIISADEGFKNVKTKKVKGFNESLGFSSFKFVPETGDNIIVALRTSEIKHHMKTYICVFTVDGNILYPETLISNNKKFEGIEFIEVD